MIAPDPFKYKCPFCNYTRVVIPKSDNIGTVDYLPFCPKCKSTMKIDKLNFFDKFLLRFKGF